MRQAHNSFQRLFGFTIYLFFEMMNWNHTQWIEQKERMGLSEEKKSYECGTAKKLIKNQTDSINFFVRWCGDSVEVYRWLSAPHNH